MDNYFQLICFSPPSLPPQGRQLHLQPQVQLCRGHRLRGHPRRQRARPEACRGHNRTRVHRHRRQPRVLPVLQIRYAICLIFFFFFFFHDLQNLQPNQVTRVVVVLFRSLLRTGLQQPGPGPRRAGGGLRGPFQRERQGQGLLAREEQVRRSNKTQA